MIQEAARPSGSLRRGQISWSRSLRYRRHEYFSGFEKLGPWELGRESIPSQLNSDIHSRAVQLLKKSVSHPPDPCATSPPP